MGDYEDLDYIVGQMKRAAIDCRMADQSFYPDIVASDYYSKWGFLDFLYRRPDENGEGGGDPLFYPFPVSSIAPLFDSVRADIDSVVSKWRDLPDGAACDDPLRRTSSAAALLGGEASVSDVGSSGEIATSCETIEKQFSNLIRGSFVRPLLDKYHSQFTKVTRGLGDACVLLHTNYAVQSAMWPAARLDVVALCEAAQSAWELKAAKSAQANREMALTVVGVVAGVVTAVVTAGTGAVAVATLSSIGGAANIALTQLSAEAAIDGADYDSVLKSLGESLSALQDALYKQEEALGAMLVEASALMQANQASFNLDAYDLGEYLIDDGTMSMERYSAGIVSDNMGRIEEVLAGAVAGLGNPVYSHPTPRGSGVGVGVLGTHTSARNLYDITVGWLRLTAAEYTRGRGLFEATAEHFFDTDDDSRQELSSLLAEEALTVRQTP